MQISNKSRVVSKIVLSMPNDIDNLFAFCHLVIVTYLSFEYYNLLAIGQCFEAPA